MTNSRSIRLWPLFLLLLTLGGALSYIWLIQSVPVRQARMVETIFTLIIFLPLILLWFLAFSRIPWKRRLQGLGVLALGAILFFVLFEFDGMSGDLVPQFHLRLSDIDTVSGTDSLAGYRTSDYPQFQGPGRDAILEGVNLKLDWELNPPELLWKRAVGDGIGGFSISGPLAITQEQVSDGEKIVAYGLSSGEIIWEQGVPGNYSSPIAGTGPRSNPTISGGRVFAMSATGWLTALDLNSGEQLWSKNVLEENNRPVPAWGKSCSPLVIDDTVVVSIYNRALIAYSAQDGSELWRTEGDGANYNSPTLLELAGRRQIVSFNSRGPAGYDPASGELLWSLAWPRGSEHVALPVPTSGNRLLVSTGYGVGAKLFDFSRWSEKEEPAELWQSPFLKSKFANFFIIGDHIYGLDDGIMVCLDLETGQRVWKRGRYGHGQMILAGETLLVLTEEGRLVAIDPDPSGLQEVASHPVLEGHTWNPPALAGEILVVRNSRQAAAYRLPLRD